MDAPSHAAHAWAQDEAQGPTAAALPSSQAPILMLPRPRPHLTISGSSAGSSRRPRALVVARRWA